MQKSESRLTVYFENPFWVAVYERSCDGELEVSKITFGAEPKDSEVFDFFLLNFGKLSFSPPVNAELSAELKKSPKRVQREINKVLDSKGIGTKSQQALKLQHEQTTGERKQRAIKLREENTQLKFELHKQKQKEKHRGR